MILDQFKYKFLFIPTLILFIEISFCKANNVNDSPFSPIIHFLGTSNKFRNISEINLMIPLIQDSNNLILSDIKLKNDNRRSSEYNIGLAYRHNFSDKLIFGFYNYFDQRATANNLHVNQWTTGVDLLSKYIDGRFNIYISQNKKKIIKPSSIEFVRDKTKIYGLKKGAIEERALSGYDIEFGVPIFGMKPKLNETLGTKFYVGRYYFEKKRIAKNIGTRLRLEQPIYNDYFNKRNSEMMLFLGSSKTNRDKWNNFVGLSFRMEVGKNSSNFTKTGLNKRMMDNIVRDIDIVTSSYQVNTSFVPIYWDKQLVNNIYFIGDTDNEDYEGNGTYENPYTKKQFQKLKANQEIILQSTDVIIPIKLDKELDEDEYNDLINECSILNDEQEELLQLKAESTLFDINKYFPDLYKTKIITTNIEKTIDEDIPVVNNSYLPTFDNLKCINPPEDNLHKSDQINIKSEDFILLQNEVALITEIIENTDIDQILNLPTPVKINLLTPREEIIYSFLRENKINANKKFNEKPKDVKAVQFILSPSTPATKDLNKSFLGQKIQNMKKIIKSLNIHSSQVVTFSNVNNDMSPGIKALYESMAGQKVVNMKKIIKEQKINKNKPKVKKQSNNLEDSPSARILSPYEKAIRNSFMGNKQRRGPKPKSRNPNQIPFQSD